jgi:hypothetical protein
MPNITKLSGTVKILLVVAALLLLFAVNNYHSGLHEISVEVVEPEPVIDITGGGGYSAPAPSQPSQPNYARDLR